MGASLLEPAHSLAHEDTKKENTLCNSVGKLICTMRPKERIDDLCSHALHRLGSKRRCQSTRDNIDEDLFGGPRARVAREHRTHKDGKITRTLAGIRRQLGVSVATV